MKTVLAKDIKQGMVILIPTREGHPPIQAKIEEVHQSMISGMVVISYHANGRLREKWTPRSKEYEVVRGG